MAQHTLRTHPLVVRQVQVLRTTDITPRMRRVTLGGSQLRPFRSGDLDLPGFISEAFDDHIKLIFSTTDQVQEALPVQRAHSIDWLPCEHRAGRDYTPRRWDPETGELDLDFVLHGDGPAASWARAATPGSQLWFVGPKSSTVLPEGIDWFLLAGDETALPAIGRFLDERPHAAPARIVVQVADDSARQELALGPEVSLQWVTSADPMALEAAVRSAEWPAGQPYVWLASESSSLVPLRRWVRRERGVPASHTNITGYWHTRDVRARQVDLSVLDPAPWLATRAALELGLLEALGDEPAPLPVVAAALDVHPTDLEPLAGYLVQLDVVAQDESGVRLGPRGEVLVGDEHSRGRYFGPGVGGDVLPAMLHLAEGLRAGRSAWQVARRSTLAETLAADGELFGERMHDAESLAFVARGVPALDVWQRASTIVLTGPGAPTVARAATEAGTAPCPPSGEEAAHSIRISPRRAPQGVLEEDVAGQFPVEDVRHANLAVSVMEVEDRDDGEVHALLQDLATVADRVLVVEATERSGPGTGGPGRRHSLLTHAAAGAVTRDEQRLVELARTAGWALVQLHHLGWDYVALDLRR